MDYKIRVFSQLDDELREIWYNFEKDSYHTCFNSMVWIENYISTYKDYRRQSQSQLRIFVVLLQNKPVCILPFEIIKKFKINVLQWACDIKSDFNAPIQKKNFKFEQKSFKNVWKQILDKIPEVDVIYLKKQINFFGVSNNPFIDFLKNSKEGNIQRINLPNTWKDYVNDILKKKFYQDLMRTKKLIKKYGKVEFVIAKNSEEKKYFLDILIKQKKKKLEKIDVNSLTERDLDFYKNFEIYENKQYLTQASAIKLNGEFIAMHWGVIGDKYYYYLLPSMKEEGVKKFQPGKLLLSLLIRRSISKKLKYFDFGLGEEPYKSKWSNNSLNIYNHIRLKRLKGIFFYLMLKIRQMIKHLKININK